MKRPVAIFDSGLGGLTVVAELRRQLPKEWFVYFGDTARVPYGCKSAQTVTRFAMQAVEFLLQFDPKIIVAACNTASAMALETLKEAVDVPIVGVVEPGAQAAVRAAEGKCIAVIATEATIHSRAYERAIWRQDQQVKIVAKACPLLVSMVEEGRGPTDPLVQMAVKEYLEPLKKQEPGALLLGCTHYPLLRQALAKVMGEKTILIDSAHYTAKQVGELLGNMDKDADGPRDADGPSEGSIRCFVSDNPQRFACLGANFLDEPLGRVSLVPLDALIAEPGSALGVLAMADGQSEPEQLDQANSHGTEPGDLG